MNVTLPGRQLVPCVLGLMISCASAIAGEEQTTETDNTGASGKGVVLEFDAKGGSTGDGVQAPDDSGHVEFVPVETGNAGIEMIIGGQGKEGVAKKGVLPAPD